MKVWVLSKVFAFLFLAINLTSCVAPSQGTSVSEETIRELQSVILPEFPWRENPRIAIPEYIRKQSKKEKIRVTYVLLHADTSFRKHHSRDAELDPFGGLGNSWDPEETETSIPRIPVIGGAGLHNITAWDAWVIYTEMTDQELWEEEGIIFVGKRERQMLKPLSLPKGTRKKLQRVQIPSINIIQVSLRDAIESINLYLRQKNSSIRLQLDDHMPAKTQDQLTFQLSLSDTNVYELLQIVCSMHDLEYDLQSDTVILLRPKESPSDHEASRLTQP